MTDQDRAEIRQMIREELNARGVAHLASACNHQWYVDYTLTVPTTLCRICGAYPTADNNAFVISVDPNPRKVMFPNAGNPIITTVTPDPKDSIPTVSPEY